MERQSFFVRCKRTYVCNKKDDVIIQWIKKSRLLYVNVFVLLSFSIPLRREKGQHKRRQREKKRGTDREREGEREREKEKRRERMRERDKIIIKIEIDTTSSWSETSKLSLVVLDNCHYQRDISGKSSEL